MAFPHSQNSLTKLLNFPSKNRKNPFQKTDFLKKNQELIYNKWFTQNKFSISKPTQKQEENKNTEQMAET